MLSYDQAHALRLQAQQEYEALEAAKQVAFTKYMQACRTASEAYEREQGDWSPNSLTTTLDTTVGYGLTDTRLVAERTR